MIRKLLLPAVAVALLGGCVSAGYSYHQGRGDYYHGAPSVEYRYHSPYPYGYYGSSRFGGYPYAYPYGYRQYYDPYGYYYGYPYGYPYGNPYYYRRPVIHVQPRVDPTPDIDRSHWRDLNRLRRREHPDVNVPQAPSPMATPQPQLDPAPRGGSALGERIRSARERDRGDGSTP